MKQIRTIIILAIGLCAANMQIAALQHTQTEQKSITAEERDTLSHELIQALKSGNHKRAQNAINMGADVNYTQTTWPPLFLAVNRGDITAIKMLLAQPSLNINLIAQNGQTPIMYTVIKSTYASTQAEQNNLYTIIQIMLEHGADPYIKTADGKNAFDGLFDKKIIAILKEGHEAYLEKLRAQEAKRVLAERPLLPGPLARLVGEYVYPADMQEERPTQAAFIAAPSTATGSAEQKKVASEQKTAATETKISAEARAQANQELIEAVTTESLAGIKAALKNGADINAPNYRNFKKTALMAAASAGLFEIATYLLTINNIDLNAQDAGGHTALIWAIREKHPNIVRLLLQRGAAPNIDDASGNDAYMWSKNSTAEIRKILEDYKATITPAALGAGGAGAAGN